MCAMYMKFDEWEKESERKSILTKRAGTQNISKLKNAALVDVDKSGQYSRTEISIGGQKFGGKLLSPKADSFKIPRRDSFTFASSSEDGLERSLDEDVRRKRLLVTPRRKRKREGPEVFKDKSMKGKIHHFDSETAGFRHANRSSYPEERKKIYNNRKSHPTNDKFNAKEKTVAPQKTSSASKQVRGRSFKDLVNLFSDEANNEELSYESSDDEDLLEVPSLLRQGFGRVSDKSLPTKYSARGAKECTKEKGDNVDRRKDGRNPSPKQTAHRGNINAAKTEGIFNQLRKVDSSSNEQSSDHESESDDIVKGHQSEVKGTGLAKHISKAGKVIRSTSCDSFSRVGKNVTLKRSESSLSSRNSAKSASMGKQEKVFKDSDKEKVVFEIFGSHSESSHDESDDANRHSKTKRNVKSCVPVNLENNSSVDRAIKCEENLEKGKTSPWKGHIGNPKNVKHSSGASDKEDSREGAKEKLGLEKKNIEKIRAIVKRKDRKSELLNKDSSLQAASVQSIALSPSSERAAVNNTTTTQVAAVVLPVNTVSPADASLNNEKLGQQPPDLDSESALDKVTPFVELVVRRISDQNTDNSGAGCTSTSAIFSVIAKGASCTEKELTEQICNIVQATSHRNVLPIRIVTVLNKDLYTSVLAKNTVDSIPEFIITSIL